MKNHYTGTCHCQKCGQPFTVDHPCCCSHASFDDGSHEDGYCRACCVCHTRRRTATDGIGGYERIDG